MIEKANRNNEKLGYSNVEFKFGDIEAIPLENDFSDVVISNCVLNLVPDKFKAFNEIRRILAPGGHFCVSDIVVKGEMNENIKEDISLYAGCISGAVQFEEYLKVIENAQFKNVQIKKIKKIVVPETVLSRYLSEKEINEFNGMDKGIFSLTIVGYK